MSNEFQSGPRSSYRAKRKKTNLILNSLIVLVLALIVFVAYSIFSTGEDKAATEKSQPETVEKQIDAEKKEDENKEDELQEEDAVETGGTEAEAEEVISPEAPDESQAVITEGDGSSVVLKTIENPSWKPIGTAQAGEHVPVYDDESLDWQEMLTAISYATGLDQNNMHVYWLGSDKTQSNASVGTVYTNEPKQIYRVYIKWVDGAGWMPTRVEELAELQK